MRRPLLFWMTVGCVSVLAACTRLSELESRYEFVTLQPVAVSTRDQLEHSTGGGLWCFYRHGLGSAIPEPDSGANQVLLGYDGFDDRGTPPFPCSESAVHYFSGAVRFDLTTVPREAANLLLIAVLKGQRRPTPVRNVSDSDCEDSSFRSIKRATAEWEGGYASGRFESASGPNMFCELSDDRETLRCNLNNIVRQWISGERANLGVVLLGPRYHGLGANIYLPTFTCAHYYENLHLEIAFVRSDH